MQWSKPVCRDKSQGPRGDTSQTFGKRVAKLVQRQRVLTVSIEDEWQFFQNLRYGFDQDGHVESSGQSNISTNQIQTTVEQQSGYNVAEKQASIRCCESWLLQMSSGHPINCTH